MSRKRDVSVNGVSSVIMPKTIRENIFFLKQLFFIQYTQDFYVAVSGATWGKGLKPPYAESLRKFNFKIRAFELVLDLI